MALEEIANAEEIVNDLECSIYFCLERMLLDRQEKLSSVEVDMLHSISHSIVAQKHHQPSNLLEIKAHPVFQNTQRIFPEQNPLALVGIQVNIFLDLSTRLKYLVQQELFVNWKIFYWICCKLNCRSMPALPKNCSGVANLGRQFCSCHIQKIT